MCGSWAKSNPMRFGVPANPARMVGEPEGSEGAWVLAAARNLAVAALVMCGVVGVGATAMTELARAQPPGYAETVLQPTEMRLAAGQVEVQAAWQAAAAGDREDARRTLEAIHARQAAYVREVLDKATPPPALRAFHADLRSLALLLGDVADLAARCLAPAPPPACARLVPLVEEAAAQGKVLLARLAELKDSI